MPIYTRKGDDGRTELLSGAAIDKDSARVNSYGTIDELNSCLGIAEIYISDDLNEIVNLLQKKLFDLAAEIATPAGVLADENHPVTRSISRINGADVAVIEKHIDKIDGNLPSLSNFVIPGGTKASAFLHLSRTVCRRAERHVVSLSKEVSINKDAVKYLNRLSDLLFVMARYENQKKGYLDKQIKSKQE